MTYTQIFKSYPSLKKDIILLNTTFRTRFVNILRKVFRDKSLKKMEKLKSQKIISVE
jgi:hypothetical protein